MAEERNMHQQHQSHKKPSHSMCEKHKYYHVMVTLEDGSAMDGIIIDVKDDGITILISEDVMLDENGAESEDSNDRQYGYGGYGRRRARRFRRSFFPLASLTALALYPYFAPYPYPYYSPYPYYY